MPQTRCSGPHQVEVNPSSSRPGGPGEGGRGARADCDICGKPTAVEDSYGVRLCELHAVEAVGLDVLRHQIRWDLTPAGELAANHPDAELCRSCGAPAGTPARRPTCLWTKHQRATHGA